VHENCQTYSLSTDTPEIFWSEPSLQPLYNAIRGKWRALIRANLILSTTKLIDGYAHLDYLEIPQRAAILNDRCTVISDLLSMLREHMNNFGVE